VNCIIENEYRVIDKQSPYEIIVTVSRKFDNRVINQYGLVFQDENQDKISRQTIQTGKQDAKKNFASDSPMGMRKILEGLSSLE